MVKNTTLKKTESVLGGRMSAILALPLFAIVELLFIFPTLDVFLAPVLALLLCYFYFVPKQKLLVTAILVFGNDALGTLVAGSLSTVYLIFLFLLWEIINLRKLRIRSLALLGVGAVVAIFPSFFGVISFKMGIVTVAYVAMLVLLHQNEEKNEDFIEKLKFALSCIIFLQALHLLVTGGVIVEEETGRAGLIGIGIGDANYSALVLCIGVASVLNYQMFKWPIKLVGVGVMIAALVATLSISGLIALFVVIVFSLSLDKKFYKVIFRVLIVLLALVIVYQVYVALPDNLRIEGVDDYIARVEEKLDFAASGDLDAATTDRSALANKKIEYLFSEASTLRQIFGFNALNVGGGASHNTYIDFLLQFGIVGAILVIAYMAIRFVRSAVRLKRGERSHKYILTLKLLLLFFAFTVSIYQGPTFAMLFVSCFLL